MVNLINSWAQGIIIAIIISTIIEIILPKGNNKKYVKTIIGIYILFVTIYPLVSKISNKNININSILENTNKKMNEYTLGNLSLETGVYIEETYKEKIKKDITEKLEQRGYRVVNTKLDIETKSEEFYGKLKNIYLQISKIETNEKDIDNTHNTINEIKDVEVTISKNIVEKEVVEDNNILEDEIKSLKEYLNNEFGTSIENIHINE